MLPECFKPDVFFKAVQRCLVDSGFVLVSAYSISTDDLSYHVPCRAARETYFTVHQPGVGFLLNVVHNERDFQDRRGYTAIWSIDVFLRFQRLTEMLKIANPELTAYNNKYEDWDGWTGSGWREPPRPPIPFYGKDVELPNFRGCSVTRHVDSQQVIHHDYEQSSTPEEIPATEIAISLKGIREQVLPYLAPGRFPRLSAYDFYPHYTFGSNDDIRLEQLFRERFDVTYMRRTVCDYLRFFHRNKTNVKAK